MASLAGLHAEVGAAVGVVWEVRSSVLGSVREVNRAEPVVWEVGGAVVACTSVVGGGEVIKAAGMHKARKSCRLRTGPSSAVGGDGPTINCSAATLQHEWKICSLYVHVGAERMTFIRADV